MRKFRFNIATLLAVILVLGVGFAALRESTDLWQCGLFTVVLISLLVASLLAVHRTERKRAFWLGFALFGWIYLAVTLVPSIESRLITTKALAFLDSKVDRSNSGFLSLADLDSDGSLDLYVANYSPPMALNNKFVDVTKAAGLSRSPNLVDPPETLLTRWLARPAGTTANFMKIGHSLLALVFALLGGQVSRYLHSRTNERAPGISLP